MRFPNLFAFWIASLVVWTSAGAGSGVGNDLSDSYTFVFSVTEANNADAQAGDVQIGPCTGHVRVSGSISTSRTEDYDGISVRVTESQQSIQPLGNLPWHPLTAPFVLDVRAPKHNREPVLVRLGQQNPTEDSMLQSKRIRVGYAIAEMMLLCATERRVLEEFPRRRGKDLERELLMTLSAPSQLKIGDYGVVPAWNMLSIKRPHEMWVTPQFHDGDVSGIGLSSCSFDGGNLRYSTRYVPEGSWVATHAVDIEAAATTVTSIETVEQIGGLLRNQGTTHYSGSELRLTEIDGEGVLDPPSDSP